MEPPSSVQSAAFLAQTRAPQILIGAILPTVIVTIFVFARLYSRLIILKSWGWDDSIISASWVVTSALTILTCVETKYGAGRHMAVVQPVNISNIVISMSFAARILYLACLALIKLGICAFYLRIFKDRTSIILVNLIVAFILITSICLIFATIFQCHPLAAAWSVDHGICFISIPQAYAIGITSIIADIFMLAFVIPRILNLKMAPKQKISCLAIVSLSALSIIAAAIRLDRLLWTARHSEDLPWDSYDVGIWNLVEVDVGLFCASAPAIKPLLRKIAPNILSSLADSTTPSAARTRPIGSSRVRGLVSRHSDALELSSQTDIKLSANAIERPKNTWLDRKNMRKSSSDSEAGIASPRSFE